MRVVGATLRRLGGSLGAEVQSARGRWTRREGLLLTLTDDEGNEGCGESSPLPGYSPDTLEDCSSALEDVLARLPSLDERAPFEALTLAWEAPSLAALPSARFALETALLDLVARRSGRTLAEALSGGAVRGSYPRSALLPGDPERWTSSARACLSEGYRTLKVKVGVRPFEDELSALSMLRCNIGGSWSLRLDANGAWGAEARARLGALAGLGVELVEEPVSGEALCGLGACAVPWAADESLADPALAARLWEAPGCGALVLKPALLGLSGAWSLARRAASRGLPVIVTHLWDGPVALRACEALALAAPGVLLACGLAPHDGLSALAPRPSLRPERCSTR